MQGNYAVYETGPVLSALSLSLASALRRVLLSSLPGAAITSVRIEGIQHELQDIPEVKEDVTDIVQNLKKIRLRSFSDRTVHLSLDVHGESTVRAVDIKAPGSIDIVTPFAHIATLDNEKAHLQMEMTVDVGRGFIPASAQTSEPQPIGVILVDAVYSPILHVNFTIEHTHMGDKIILEITTDGTISPDEALRQSADILVRQLTVVKDWYRPAVPLEQDTRKSTVPIPPHIYTIPIEELGLSFRVVNNLKRNGIGTVGPLLEKNDLDFRYMRNIGDKSLQEIANALRIKGLFPENY